MTGLAEPNPSYRPSSAGVCQVCGRYADRRYGGEGRYLVMCLDCWLAEPNPSSRLESALAEEWCNGCGLPRKQWGPVCAGMTQGDWTHYHSADYWRLVLSLKAAPWA